MTTSELSLVMGPNPSLSIAALRELGMSRTEVARYFRIEHQDLSELEATSDRDERSSELRPEAPRV